MTKAPINIIWFKRDLRVEDHAALNAAAAHGHVIPLYVFEPDLWQQPDTSWRHWHFIHDSLSDLKSNLQQAGAGLVTRHRPILEVLNRLREECGQFTLWSHEETGNAWTFARDKNVAAWCKAHGIVWHEFQSHGVKRRLKDRDGWAMQRDEFMRDRVLKAPQNLVFHPLKSDPLPAKSTTLLRNSGDKPVQSGGRKEGLKTLHSFLNERAARYMQTISKPGVSARHCSRLSAHIAYGTLSVREIVTATEKRVTELSQRNDPHALSFARNLRAFSSRLSWRCHFVQKLEQQPRIETQCMNTVFEGMREHDFNEDFFQRWQEGQTGYPLIDAAMRSLHENGWITFRMRAMLVSFASYHLWLDWRRTAPFVARLFTDYEPGIHYSQFQMQSGVTGINAVRIYNPIKQSYDHDPQAKFIRRYIPELKSIPDSFIHEPWRAETPPPAYPAPIVDHDTAVKLARTRMKEYWSHADFKNESRRVFEKLGSRSRPPQRRRAEKTKTAKTQLNFLDALDGH